MTEQRPPVPPFTLETARHKVQAAEDAWNSRDPARVAGAYTVDSVWRNRDTFGGSEFVQVVEFTEFARPRRLHTHIVEGPQPVDGTWELAAAGDGTRLEFVAEGSLQGLARLAGPLVKRVMGREFAKYHGLLKRNVEARGGG